MKLEEIAKGFLESIHTLVRLLQEAVYSPTVHHWDEAQLDKALQWAVYCQQLARQVSLVPDKGFVGALDVKLAEMKALVAPPLPGDLNVAFLKSCVHFLIQALVCNPKLHQSLLPVTVERARKLGYNVTGQRPSLSEATEISQTSKAVEKALKAVQMGWREDQQDAPASKDNASKDASRDTSKDNASKDNGSKDNTSKVASKDDASKVASKETSKDNTSKDNTSNAPKDNMSKDSSASKGRDNASCDLSKDNAASTRSLMESLLEFMVATDRSSWFECRLANTLHRFTEMPNAWFELMSFTCCDLRRVEREKRQDMRLLILLVLCWAGNQSRMVNNQCGLWKLSFDLLAKVAEFNPVFCDWYIAELGRIGDRLNRQLQVDVDDINAASANGLTNPLSQPVNPEVNELGERFHQLLVRDQEVRTKVLCLLNDRTQGHKKVLSVWHLIVSNILN